MSSVCGLLPTTLSTGVGLTPSGPVRAPHPPNHSNCSVMSAWPNLDRLDSLWRLYREPLWGTYFLSLGGAKLATWKPGVGNHLCSLWWLLIWGAFWYRGMQKWTMEREADNDCVVEGPVSICACWSKLALWEFYVYRPIQSLSYLSQFKLCSFHM